MSKKIKKEEEIELSILDLARLEKKLPREAYNKPDGSGKKNTKEVFRMWCVLPETYKGVTPRIIELLGYQDPLIIELLNIKTMVQFAEMFGCSVYTLTRWKKEIETKDDYLDEVRRMFKPMTKNFMAALYRKGLEEGDAQRFKAWMEVVEGWKQQLGIEHSGNLGDGLTPEERTALDNLLVKNTQ